MYTYIYTGVGPPWLCFHAYRMDWWYIYLSISTSQVCEVALAEFLERKRRASALALAVSSRAYNVWFNVQVVCQRCLLYLPCCEP